MLIEKWTLSNIEDRDFSENFSRLSAVDSLWKELYFRCLTGFWILLWGWIWKKYILPLANHSCNGFWKQLCDFATLLKSHFGMGACCCCSYTLLPLSLLRHSLRNHDYCLFIAYCRLVIVYTYSILLVVFYYVTYLFLFIVY